MLLSAYLEQIGVTGPLHPDVETLYTLHRAHLQAIPYENLDIHFGRQLVLDEAQIYHKIVHKAPWRLVLRDEWVVGLGPANHRFYRPPASWNGQPGSCRQ